jgi:hypothetical protein
MKIGAYSTLADAGVPFSQIDQVMKQADGLPSISVGGTAKAVVALSVLTGIPIGIAAHAIGNRITKERGRERELGTQAGYYRNAAQQLHQGLDAAEAAQ